MSGNPEFFDAKDVPMPKGYKGGSGDFEFLRLSDPSMGYGQTECEEMDESDD